MKSNKKILIRVDASAEIGTGHVMRCLLLADRLKDYDATIRFVSRHMLDNLQKTIIDHGHEFIHLQKISATAYQGDLDHSHWLGTSQSEDMEATKSVCSDSEWDWIVVDNYALDYRWESCFKNDSKILVIDDIADRRHDCDMLLDQNFHSEMRKRYSSLVNESCNLLLGPNYALLRDEFRTARHEVRIKSGSVENIMVFFGGIDKKNYTGRTINILRDTLDGNINVEVVIGANHGHRAEIEKICNENAYRLHIQIDNIAEIILRTDLSIGAGGTSVWERCCLGVPCICFPIANNQMEQLKSAALHGLILLPDDNNDFESSLITQLHAITKNKALIEFMSRRCLDKVGVKGLDYVVTSMGFTGVRMRPVNLGDSDSLYTWRNHPEIRKASINQSSISRAEHDKWLRASLDNKNRYMLICEMEGESLGVVRFDIEGNFALLSIYLVPDYISKGYGHRILRAAEMWCEENLLNIEFIKAMVLSKNKRSEKLFQRSGYNLEASAYVKRLSPV